MDAAYGDKIAMSFDITTCVCIDLRVLCGKFHLLEWVTRNFLSVASARHLTAGLVFVDGVRFAKGLRRTDFFAGTEASANDNEPEPDSLYVVDEERGMRLEAVQRKAESFTLEGVAALAHAADGIAQDLVDSWAAYDRFCNERLAVPAETTLLAWSFPFVAELKATLKRYEQLTPDAEKTAELYGCVAANWNRRFRREQ